MQGLDVLFWLLVVTPADPNPPKISKIRKRDVTLAVPRKVTEKSHKTDSKVVEKWKMSLLMF